MHRCIKKGMFLMAPSTEKKPINFDQWAPTYDRSRNQRFYGSIHRTVLTFVASHIQPNTLLDLGCGTGRLLYAAKQRWPDAILTGIDPSAKMVEVARRSLPDATFFVGQAETLPLPDSSVEMVVSTVSFHHWRNHLAGLR